MSGRDRPGRQAPQLAGSPSRLWDTQLPFDLGYAGRDSTW